MAASNSSRAVTAPEVLLLSLGFATLSAAACVALDTWIEGLHFASTLRAPGPLAYLWLRYAAAFALPALLGWGVARVLLGARAPIARLFGVLVACQIPASIGIFATRSALLAPLPLVAGTLAVALLLACLRFAASPEHPRAGRFAVAALVSAPAVATALNVLGWLRPAIFAGTPERWRAAGICSLAALSAAPLCWAVQAHPPRRRLRRLLGVDAAYAATLVLLVVASPALLRRSDLPAGIAQLRGPPVLLVVVDTLRADAVSGFGGEPAETPELRELAADATTFTRAYAAAPWTTPSFGSLLTSVYPSEHRAGSPDHAIGFKQALAESLPTLPHLLAEQGYWTGAVLTNGYLGRRFGLASGFDRYENLLAVEWGHPILVGLASLGCFEIQPFVRADEQTARVLEAVRHGQDSGRPFFVLAHFMDPHMPHREIGGQATVADLDPKTYAAEVTFTDRHIGILMRELKAMGLYDRMLIVVTADHGEELVEGRGAGAHGHGHTLFDELLHVPLIVKRPSGAGAGTLREEAVSLIDVGPTILDLVGLEIPDGFRGRPLLGRRAAADPSRILFSERILYGSERKAAIQDHYKVVMDPEDADGVGAQAYDLARDPKELQPIDPRDARFRTLLAALSAFSRADSNSRPVRSAELDLGLRKRLEALGYLN